MSFFILHPLALVEAFFGAWSFAASCVGPLFAKIYRDAVLGAPVNCKAFQGIETWVLINKKCWNKGRKKGKPCLERKMKLNAGKLLKYWRGSFHLLAWSSYWWLLKCRWFRQGSGQWLSASCCLLCLLWHPLPKLLLPKLLLPNLLPNYSTLKLNH